MIANKVQSTKLHNENVIARHLTYNTSDKNNNNGDNKLYYRMVVLSMNRLIILIYTQVIATHKVVKFKFTTQIMNIKLYVCIYDNVKWNGNNQVCDLRERGGEGE